jgi:hypothetical protein
MRRVVRAFIALCALASLAPRARAAVNISDVSVAPAPSLDVRGLTLDVFTYAAPPTRVPDIRGGTPAHTTTRDSVSVGALPLASGSVNANALARFRGRIRPNVTGTTLFALDVNAGGSLSLNGGVTATSNKGGNITGWKFLRAGEDVEMEAIGYNGASGSFSMTLYWREPMSSALVRVPATVFYKSLDACCACVCGEKPCRLSEDQTVAECFERRETGGAGTSASSVTSLESVFGVQ